MRMGIGSFQQASFALPQNPVGLAGLADFVAGSFAVPQNPVVLSGLGDTVPTAPMYPIPQNTVITGWRAMGMNGLGCGDKCDCGGKCGGHGVGAFDLSTITSSFSTAIADVGTAISSMSLAPITSNDWMVLGTSAVLLYLISDSLSKGGRRR